MQTSPAAHDPPEVIPTAFRRQVEARPEAEALVFPGGSWTYSDLSSRSRQIAHRLRALGVGHESLVALPGCRSPRLIAAFLGILEAGGAYLPLDPDAPAARLALLVGDAGVGVLVSEGALPEGLRELDLPHLDLEDPTLAQESTDALPAESTAESLAYVMHTSGSTGEPKGVEVLHRGVVRLVRDVDYVDLGPDQRHLQLAPLSFDASTFEIWGALLNGGTLVLPPAGPLALDALEGVLRDQQVSCLWLTATLFNTVVDERPEALREVGQVLTGGEALSLPHVRRALDLLPDTRLVNGYGPTEGTTFTCCHTITREGLEGCASVPIGRPIANTTAYVLDEHGELVPEGVSGELVVGGAGVARGYRNRPDLTAERFAPDRFDPDGGGLLYRTGDRVRRLADGALEFLGRFDDQVKIRGHRIEPGEVEAALLRHPDVRQAVVRPWEEAGRTVGLAAYVVPATGATASEDALHQHLGRLLPRWMLPAAYLRLEELPRTPNGKVDREALPRPDGPAGKSGDPPRTETERRLAAIWRDILDRERIGRNDDFFRLGASSLEAMRMVARVERALGCNVALSRFFEEPTIAGLAGCLISTVAGIDRDPVLVLRRGRERPPVFCLPGIGGHPVVYRELAYLLTKRHEVLGLELPGVSEFEPEASTVETMADVLMPHVRRVQPHGPYMFVGYSFGALIVYELANRLQAHGEHVVLLAMLDGFAPNSYRSVPRHRKVVLHTQHLLREGPSYLLRKVRERMRAWRKQERVPGDSKQVAEDLREPWVQAVRDRFYRAIELYQPRPYVGDLELINAARRSIWFQTPGEGAHNGWRDLVHGRIRVREVDCAHLDMFSRENVDAVANQLDAALATARDALR